MIPVTLEWSEVVTASFVGVQRRVIALRKLRGAAHGYRDDGKAFDQDIEAACAEMAAAKALCVYWPVALGRLDTEAGDLGEGIQVRSTRRDNGCLIVHDTDADEDVFILVTGQMPNYRVHGWKRAREAKQERYYRKDTGRPAYFVPQDKLLPLAEGPRHASGYPIAQG